MTFPLFTSFQGNKFVPCHPQFLLFINIFSSVWPSLESVLVGSFWEFIDARLLQSLQTLYVILEQAKLLPVLALVLKLAYHMFQWILVGYYGVLHQIPSYFPLLFPGWMLIPYRSCFCWFVGDILGPNFVVHVFLGILLLLSSCLVCFYAGIRG